MTTLGDVVDLVHDWYPPATAESWDAVGLVYGEPTRPVRRIALAVDPTLAVAREAASWGADLLLTHHPLFLTPVHGFPATTPKGRALTTLADAGCGLLTAHTNADQAPSGVCESLAEALGVQQRRPLVPTPGDPVDKLVCFVPHDDADALRAALARSGAGALGDYSGCSFTSTGEGRFLPGDGASPAIGAVGRPETVAESKVEVVLPRARRREVVAAMIAAHPYEEPAYDLFEMADPGTGESGTGRVGTIPAESLGEFAGRVAAALPATAQGVRVAGDPERRVERVALCGGAGDFLLDQVARSDADVYLTSDLRHHPASEFCEQDGPALVDVAHWAAEWTWLPVVETRLRAALGDTVETVVSRIPTDPWSFRV